MAIRKISPKNWHLIFSFVSSVNGILISSMKAVCVAWNRCLRKKWTISLTAIRGPCENCDGPSLPCCCIHTHDRNSIFYICAFGGSSLRCGGTRCTNKYPCKRKGFVCKRTNCPMAKKLVQYCDETKKKMYMSFAEKQKGNLDKNTDLWLNLTRKPSRYQSLRANY